MRQAPSSRDRGGCDGVAAGHKRLPPGAVVEVPLHGEREADLEGVLRRPAELGVELRAIDGVAEIVAGPIGDEGDELAVRRPPVRGASRSIEVADRGHDIDVAALGIAADVVGLARRGLFPARA